VRENRVEIYRHDLIAFVRAFVRSCLHTGESGKGRRQSSKGEV